MTPSKTTQEYTALNGALVFTMRPFRTIQTNIIVADMERILDAPVGEAWDVTHHAFCLTLGATVDVKCIDQTNAEALAVVEYWERVKDKATVDKWALYPSHVSVDAELAWWEAYQATRKKPSTPAPEILQTGEPTDPNLEGSGGTPTG